MRLDPVARLHAMDLREFGVSALFAAVVLFVAAMVMLNQNVVQLRRSFDWVERAHVIQKRIDDVNNSMNSVEMTVRGFALTGDLRFLERYKKMHAVLMGAVKDLDDLAMVETALRPAIKALQTAVDGHEALYGTLIGHGPAEQAIVAEAITNPSKRLFSAKANNVLSRMEHMERRLFEARYAEAEREAAVTYRVAIGIAGLAFLTGTLGFALALFGRRHDHGEGAGMREIRP